MRHTLALFATLALVAGCDFNFETPSIVIDLRVLGARAEPPEVVVDLDPENPAPALAELAEHPFTITVLVADPGETRRLEWEMIACPEDRQLRCLPDDAQQVIGTGVVDAPSAGGAPPTASFVPNLAVLENAVSADDLLGFGGIVVMVQIKIWPEGQPDAAIYASKRVVVAPRQPASRVANENPVLAAVTVGNEDEPSDDVLTPADCAAGGVSRVVAPGERVVLFPTEREGSRQDYVLPTFNGGSREFTEYMSYSWFATRGEWAREQSGGPKGTFGPAEFDTAWTAPSAGAGGAGDDVAIWVVQRDERGGLSWTTYCMRVER